MSESFDHPIIVVKRICPEHRVRIYEGERLWEKASQEFRLYRKRKQLEKPWQDHNGLLITHNENCYFLDDRFAATDQRHIVLHTFCFWTENGRMGASGKMDPKEMLVGNVLYRQLAFENPECALCIDGDMIPREQRFFSSSYKP